MVASPRADRVIVDKDVRIPMRDGVVLGADVHRPDAPELVPALLQRVPYGKDVSRTANFAIEVGRAVAAGYAVVVQDCRGRHSSDGRFTPFADEAHDGADSVRWIADAPWCDGTVGMVGGSYSGLVQWLAGGERPDALRAITPYLATPDCFDGWVHRGGAFELGFNLHWSMANIALPEAIRRAERGTSEPEAVAALATAVDRQDEEYAVLPLAAQPRLAQLAPHYGAWLAHPTYDEHWRSLAPGDLHDRVDVPTLSVGGWYDVFRDGTLHGYVESAKRRPGQARLVMGPWGHGVVGAAFPERSFGLAAMAPDTGGGDLTALLLRWLDRWVRGIDNGVDREPPVKVFVMGARNAWSDEDAWPPSDVAPTLFFLRGGGTANTASGDGELSLESPGDEPADRFHYDPRDPVPTVGGATFLPGLAVAANAGPRDQRAVEGRDDVLCYTTPPLERPLTIIGPLRLELHVSSSALDTDFTAKLVDVMPDGTAMNVTEGIQRARYRYSRVTETLLAPGEPTRLDVDMGATAYVFAASHSVRLLVSSSDFPRFDRNTNTGAVIALDGEEDLVVATNRVHHDRAHPSRLVLPIVDRG